MAHVNNLTAWGHLTEKIKVESIFTSYVPTQHQCFIALFDIKVIGQKQSCHLFSYGYLYKINFSPKCFMSLIKPACAETCMCSPFYCFLLLRNESQYYIFILVWKVSLLMQDIFNIKEDYVLLIKDNKNWSLLLKVFLSFFV